MRKVLGLVLLCLGLALTTFTPAQATTTTITIDQPRLVTADEALLTGAVEGTSSVNIETWASWRWRTVQTVQAEGGRYEAVVPATADPTYFRAVASRTVKTDKVTVHDGLEPVEPETPAEPEVPTEPETPTEPTTPPAGPSDACGPQPQKADGSLWQCTLNDDFDGTELDRNVWRPLVGFKAGSLSGMPCYIDDPSVIDVRDGALNLTVREVEQPLDCPLLNARATAHVAGAVSTYHLFSQQYGRFEARFKNTATDQPGLHEAFWLWPDDRYSDGTQWPVAGEIDIAETYSYHDDLVIPFLHTRYDVYGGVPGVNTAWNCRAERGVFNTYTLEWTPERLTILVNGRSCLSVVGTDSAFRKPYIIALTQALGAPGDNAYDGRAPLPATMTVDYVKVWE